ncbi:MAG: Rrf2 family transcriptional regulator [Anaerolineae bacterium]|nr:Rrf2 family transcriptional regulator [Anaerolineae bacterium]
MVISRRTDYGVRIVLDLAALPRDERAAAHDIADRQKIPRPFLAKIISQLCLAGLLTTYRGAGGGVALAKPAAEITLLEVVEVLEGPVRLNRCVIRPDDCPRNSYCPVHHIWCQAQADLVDRLGNTNFEVLARPVKEVI